LVVSDIHYPNRRTDIPDLKEYIKDTSLIFGLGDFTTMEIIRYLRSFGKPFVGVYGNKDNDAVKKTLPKTTTLEIDGVKIGLYHGSGGPQGIENRVKKAFGKKHLDAYIFGHSHIAVNKYINGAFYFNPGTLSGIRRTIGLIYIDFKNVWGKIKKYEICI